MKKNKTKRVWSGFLVVLFFLFTLFVPSMGLAIEKDHPILKLPWNKFGKEYWPSKPVRGGVFQSANQNYIGLMNAHHWPVLDWLAIGFWSEQLLFVDGKYSPTVPWLLRTWEYLDPKTVLTTVQKNVKSTDGEDFDAEAIKYNFDYILDKKNGAWTRLYFKMIKSIEVVDKYTLKWNLKESWGGFAGAMEYGGWMYSAKALKGDVAMKDLKSLKRKLKKAKKKVAKAEKKVTAAAAKGEKAVKKAETKLKKTKAVLKELEAKVLQTAELAKGAKNMDTDPVGTGPYILEEAKPGNYLQVKRNPNWWFAKLTGRPMPYFDGYRITVIPDPAIRLANLRAGKIDSLGSFPRAQMHLVTNDPKLNIYSRPTADTTGLSFMHVKGPCKDIRVRKAISHALDRKALIAGLVFGMAVEAAGIYPPSFYANNPTLKPVTYDPELSKKLLAEAGYADGLTIKGHTGSSVESQTFAEAIKAMLLKVGIDWKVDFLDSVAANDRLINLEYDLASGGWIYIWTPDSVATGLYHSKGPFNMGRTKNMKSEALVEAGLKEVDQEKRIKIYQELDKVLYDNYEDVWLYHNKTLEVYSKRVFGYNLQLYLEGGEGFLRTHHHWFKDGKRK
jgi:peptide/nickel transport system substrate-binding protein